VDEQIAGDLVGVVEAVACDGGRPGAQVDPAGPEPLFGLSGQVVGAVVVAVVTEKGCEQRAGLELCLPVLVCDGAEFGRCGHGRPSCPTALCAGQPGGAGLR
jgi:hypothetical protein